jgi:hypothetical protein
MRQVIIGLIPESLKGWWYENTITSYSYNITMTKTKIIRKEKSNRIISEVERKVFDGRGIAEIDYSETTSWNNFCKIRFEGSNEEFWIPSWRIE